MNSQPIFIFVCGLMLGSSLILVWNLRGSALPRGIANYSRLPLRALAHGTSSRNDTKLSGGRRARILCLIVTHPGNYRLKAEPVHNTWARRCDKHVFVGTRSDKKTNIPLMELNLQESRKILWRKTWMSFTQAADQFGIDNFDFFMKADDDTFVVVENLRRLLRRLDPRKPSLLGRRFALEGNRKMSYMSGGGGYVLSREAVRLFVTKGVREKKCNLEDTGSEDVLMGRCLSSLGVEHLDSRDEQKLEAFHPLTMDEMLGLKGNPSWLYTYSYYKLKLCRDCISRRSVTFHYVQNMYHMEALLYYVQPEDERSAENGNSSCSR